MNFKPIEIKFVQVEFMLVETVEVGDPLFLWRCMVRYCIQIHELHSKSKLAITDKVLKSDTLLSAAPERHSQNREQRRSATHFYQKMRCGSGTHIFEESENMSGPLLSLFFFWNFLFFWHSFSVNKLVSPSLLWFIYSWKQRYFQLDIKFLLNFQIQVCILVRKEILKKITKKRAMRECTFSWKSDEGVPLPFLKGAIWECHSFFW